MCDIVSLRDLYSKISYQLRHDKHIAKAHNMLLIHPFQRSFCVLFISLGLVFYFIHIKKEGRPGIHFSTAENSSSIYRDLFASFSGFENLSDVVGPRDIFDILKFLNSSTELRNGVKENLEHRKGSERIYILGK